MTVVTVISVTTDTTQAYVTMPMVNNRRLLPLNGVLPMDGEIRIRRRRLNAGGQSSSKRTRKAGTTRSIGWQPHCAPGGDKENKDPTENEVPEQPQESSDDDEESLDEESKYESKSESEDTTSLSSTFKGENLMLWTKETLARSVKWTTKKYNKLKDKFEGIQKEKDKLVTNSTKAKVKHQVALTSKNTTISNLSITT